MTLGLSTISYYLLKFRFMNQNQFSIEKTKLYTFLKLLSNLLNGFPVMPFLVFNIFSQISNFLLFSFSFSFIVHIQIEAVLNQSRIPTLWRRRNQQEKSREKHKSFPELNNKHYNVVDSSSYFRPWWVQTCICQHMNTRWNLYHSSIILSWSVGYIDHGFGTNIWYNQVEPIILIYLLHKFLCKVHGFLLALQPWKKF